MFANLNKCTLGTSKVVFLGYMASGDEIMVDKEKVKAIHEWPILQDVHEVRSFLALATSWRFMAPLTDCLKDSSLGLGQAARVLIISSG